MHVRFDRFYDHAELSETLEAWAAEFPELCLVESIGRSYEGRDIWLVTVTSFATGPAEEKPALLLEAQIHAIELTATTAALHLLDRLLHGFGTDERITRALETRCFYVIPRLSPDGAELALAGKWVRSSVRPYPRPEPEDGHHEEDIDGDGRILLMRVRDDNGAWTPHADEPRLLVPREPTAEGGEYYRVLYEGTIRNYDGSTIPVAAPLHGLDLNRNWPGSWRPENEQFGAGEYPTSEPETRAIVEAISSRPNICAYIAYHTMSGVHLRPFGSRPDDDFPRRDLDAYKRIGEEATRLTGYPAVSIHHEFRYDTKKDVTGGSDAWMYETLGIFMWVTEFWSPMRMAGITDYEFIGWFKDPSVEHQLALLRYADSIGGGFVDWYPFEHPQLGWVELGGWDDLHFFVNPPFSLLEEEVAPHADFAIFHALITARLGVRSFTATPIADGTHRVEVVLENTGWLPTNVTQKAIETKAVRPIELELELLEDVRLVTGRRREEIGQLDGRSKERSLYWFEDRSTADLARREWVVEAPAGSRIGLVARHERAGTARAELTIAEQ
jgi:hypothetical protein